MSGAAAPTPPPPDRMVGTGALAGDGAEASIRPLVLADFVGQRAVRENLAIFIAAACAQGETVLTGAEELRVKESDRIQVMADGLTTLGIEVEPRPDGIRIVGLRVADADAQRRLLRALDRTAQHAACV